MWVTFTEVQEDTMSVDKMQEKIVALKSQLAEERELRKAVQRELNDTKKLLSRAQSLAAKMGQACAALNEAINDGEAAAPKKAKKVKAGAKTQNTGGKPSKKDGKKVKADKPKKVVKIVESDEDDDEASTPKKAKKGGKKALSDKKPIKKGKGDKSEVKKDKSDKKVKGKGKSKSKVDDLDLDDTYED